MMLCSVCAKFDCISSLSSEKVKKRLTFLLSSSVCAALFRLGRSAGLQLLKLLSGSPRRSRQNTETHPHGPVRAPRIEFASHTSSPLSLLLSSVCLSLSPTLLVCIHHSSHLSPALSGGLTPDEVQAYHSHVITTWLSQCYTPKPQKSGWQSTIRDRKKKEGMKWKAEMDRGRQTEERQEECGKRMLDRRKEREGDRVG